MAAGLLGTCAGSSSVPGTSPFPTPPPAATGTEAQTSGEATGGSPQAPPPSPATNDNTRSVAQAPSPDSTPPAAEPNVLPFSVGAGLCASVPNTPCVAVTICQSGTNNCQTIDNLQIDSASVGLRVFRSLLNFQPQLVASGGGTLTRCEPFAGGDSVWGPVAMVDLKMGGEPAVRVPVELIDFDFAPAPPQCSAQQTTQDVNPTQMGVNGIIGLSLLTEDCGPACASVANNGAYFSCANGSCQPTTTTTQIQNPIALLPADNNGMILQTQGIPPAGATGATGQLILGIGTRPNNQPKGITALPATSNDSYAAVSTTSGSVNNMPAIFDSGTSYLTFPTNLPACGGQLSEYLCPPSTESLTATVSGSGGTPTLNVTFQVGNALTLFQSNSRYGAFDDVGSPALTSDNIFIYGFSFFYGRSIYFGIEGASSPLGQGPYFGL
jgi:hypothetical protein